MLEKWKGTAGHVAVTLIATYIYPLLGLVCAGSFIGREIAQAEYRYIEAHGGKRYSCPWYCGFLPESWTFKSILDWLLPVCVAGAVTWIRW
jgi:hypothetical protein